MLLLVTFYQAGSAERPYWPIYGHTAPYVNELLDCKYNRVDAMIYAHTFKAPVLEGSNKYHIVELLASAEK